VGARRARGGLLTPQQRSHEGIAALCVHHTSLHRLSPNRRGNWLADEEFHLALCHMLVGNQWSLHCNRLRGRTENSIKNFWNATMRSKQPNKRRGFVWAYIDRVKVALDDEALRHQALADTVRGRWAEERVSLHR
jgi:hypothetical protein